MSSHIVATSGLLKAGGRWTEEVDRVLGVALTQCRPVYLTLPTDLVHVMVSAEGLKTPLVGYLLPSSNVAMLLMMMLTVTNVF